MFAATLGMIGVIAGALSAMFYYRPIVAREKAIAESAGKDAERMRVMITNAVATVDTKIKAAKDLVVARIAGEYQKMKAGAEHKLDELLGKK